MDFSEYFFLSNSFQFGIILGNLSLGIVEISSLVRGPLKEWVASLKIYVNTPSLSHGFNDGRHLTLGKECLNALTTRPLI